MKWRSLLIILLLSLLSLPVFAQESGTHGVTFDGFSFSYDDALAQNVNILHYPGDPVEGAGAGFSDAANTIFNLYNLSPAPESPLDAIFGIRLYAMSDLARHDFMQTEVDQLQALISGRPDWSAFATSSGGTLSLPFLPTGLHGQLLRAHIQYLELDQVRGIGYITITPTMAAIEPLVSSSFVYVFQGISTDGEHYVSMAVPLTTSLFEGEPVIELEELSQQWDAYLQERAATLDAAPSDAFAPSLDSIDALIQSFAFAPA